MQNKGSRRRFSCVTAAIVLALVIIGVSANAQAAFIDEAQRKVTSDGGYSWLLNKALSEGRVRLIINLDQPFTPMGHLNESDAQLQRYNISWAQSDVLTSLSGFNISDVTSFMHTPQMALTADRAALDALIMNLSILSIEEDVPVPYTLDLSVPRIGAPTVWNQGYIGAGVNVAVLDTGVDKTHPFLIGAVVSEACYSSTGSGSNYTYTSVCPGGVTDSTAAGSALPYAGACMTGDCDHGTHVSGIVAGRNNGSFSGVAKGAGIIAIQVFTRFDYTDTTSCGNGLSHCVMAYSSDIIKGLQRVYDLRNTYNIASINMSLGGGRYYLNSSCDGDSRKPYIDNLKSVGIATVIASGNNGYKDSMSAPGCISSAVSVGATTDSDTVASYSNSASFLSLLAPGSSIYSSIPGTCSGGCYASWSGTSMATPHVAGTWALLKQANPSVTVDQVLSALQSTGLGISDTNAITKPRIQVDQAFLALPCHSQPVKIGATPYPSIQIALNNATGVQLALMRAMVFAEAPVLAVNASITLRGGYDCGFTTNPGYATIYGALTVSNGSVTIENLIIQ